VKITEAHIQWVEIKRKSRTQGIWHDQSGFVGRITYEGPLEEFLPFLLMGAYVHVGVSVRKNSNRFRPKPIKLAGRAAFPPDPPLPPAPRKATFSDWTISSFSNPPKADCSASPSLAANSFLILTHLVKTDQFLRLKMLILHQS